jgi:mRNA interferase MazF
MFGEICICQFPFNSGTQSKARPALVLFDLKQDAIICRITSALHTGSLDVFIKDWHQAGLLKPSVARLDRIVTAEKTVFCAVSAFSARATWRPCGPRGTST